tara:strand:+ start:345 stop:878 length:534 start_codon:yes stop_codon:yes gene_type:complete
MTDVNDGNFYLSRARCNRITVSLEPVGATSYIGVVSLNGKITQVALDYAGALPLQSGSGTGNFVINSDIRRAHNGVSIPYHEAIGGFPLAINPAEAIEVMDVTPGSDTQERGIFPVFFNMIHDPSGGPVVDGMGGNVPLGKTSWNGLVAGQVIFTFTLTGSSPVGQDSPITAVIYLE